MRKALLAVLVLVSISATAMADGLAQLKQVIPQGSQTGKVVGNPKYPNAVVNGAPCTVTANYTSKGSSISVTAKNAYGVDVPYDAIFQANSPTLSITEKNEVFTISDKYDYSDEDGRHHGVSHSTISTANGIIEIDNTYGCQL